ncbi:MAG: hypothetical protein ACFE8E_01660 [Candidatus Hodarchaeota archaeon]
MDKINLIFTFSGIRGIFKKDFNYDVAKKIGIAFGQLLHNKDKRVIIGRDSRPSGVEIERGVVEGLISVGYNIVSVGICPSPVIVHAKNNLRILAGIIITGSHNPQEWNGLKLLSGPSFLSNRELEEINQNISKINLKEYDFNQVDLQHRFTKIDPIPDYIKQLYEYVNYRDIKKTNNLRVVLDTGAGASKYVTPQILEGLGCKLKIINNDLLVNNIFPREIEPVAQNLRDLIMEVWQGNYDIGFAHDSDADRLALIGDTGICYPEDVVLALIADYYLKNFSHQYEKAIFITNLASSLMFNVLAEKYNAHVIRTPIGEKFLVEEIDKLGEERERCLVLGGEGSCGGVILPSFNNTRDGIFAAAKIVEIVVQTGERISTLTSQLPKYFAYRKRIEVKKVDVSLIINAVKKELYDEGEDVVQINNDLRFGKGIDWFVLIHPSNTEPIIRVISEAKTDSAARMYCEVTAELVRLVISKLS